MNKTELLKILAELRESRPILKQDDPNVGRLVRVEDDGIYDSNFENKQGYYLGLYPDKMEVIMVYSPLDGEVWHFVPSLDDKVEFID